MSLEPQRLLVAHSPERRIEAALIAPLARHAEAIRRDHGRVVEIERVSGPRRLLDWTRSASRDWLFVQSRVLHGLPPRDLNDVLERLGNQVERLVWMECQAGSAREQFRFSASVDLQIERSLLRQRRHYGRRLLQGRLHAEAVRRRFRPGLAATSRVWGLLTGERPTRAALSLGRIWHSVLRPGWHRFATHRYPERPDAVVLGWDIAVADRIVELAASTPPEHPRPIDVACRVGIATEGFPAWYALDRLEAVRATRRLGRRWRVVATSRGVPRERFHDELRSARLAVSPFGWGEVCWRDFEAILHGCLLVKPSMRHMETWPDVYRPHETYVPVRWDWSDLEAACRPYLENEQRRLEVADRARQILVASLTEESFLERFAVVAGRLKRGGS